MARNGGLTVNEIFDLLEEGNEVIAQNLSYNISIIPGFNANDYITDEDSADEEVVRLENLPPLLLNAEAEISLVGDISDDDNDDEDDIPLALLKPSKRRKVDKIDPIKWKKEDLVEEEQLAVTEHEDGNLASPLDLFSNFIDEKFIDDIVHQSNNYALKNNANGNINADEIKCFLGILLLSGYNTVSRRRMYWETAKDTHNELVSNAIRRDRFDFIFRYIHFTDNDSLDKSDKFAKVRPLVKNLNEKFQQNAPGILQHSVDEQMVPYFGRHGCKQYIHGKPIRYGYKFWVGATYKGYIVWFEPYQGAGTFVNNIYKEMGLGPSVVLSYCDILSQQNSNTNYHLYFDNLFTTLPLLIELENRNLKGTGTIRENRLRNCSLPKKKELKKKPRGWYDFRKAEQHNLVVCSWNDSSAVNVASNIHSVEPAKLISRRSQKEKLKQPKLIHQYNQYMGGVDRADENISLYRVSIRGKKWYFPIFCHCIDLAEHNAWQLHREMGGKMDHLAFRRRIATVLVTTYGKAPSVSLKAAMPHDTRFDRLDHLLTEIPRYPDGKAKQLHCKHCHNKTTTRCLKCDVPLHLKCNVAFHTKI